jgi:hypoxanthine phosphoribosyltransferase
MKTITIQDKTFTLFISAGRIRKKIRELAERMNNDLQHTRPLFIAVLNGSFMYAADLFKEISFPMEISFIKLSSYKGAASSGQVTTAIGLDKEVSGRTVVILEDIIDTGRTMHEFLPQIQISGPAQILITSLLIKPSALKFPVKVDYPGFEVPDRFMVGFGLDYNGLGRNLRDIYIHGEAAD